jgi:hypothetical protein
MIRKGFKVYEIDEFKTSKLCGTCNEETHNFKILKPEEYCSLCKKNKDCEKDHKKDGRRLKWGLKRCENSDCENFSKHSEDDYGRIYNRDLNACINIINIIEHYISTGERIEAFKRSSHITHNTNG